MHRRGGPEQLNVWGVSISTSRSLIAIDKLGLLCVAGVPSALEGTDRRPQISISTRSRQLACVYFRKLAAIDQSEPGGPYQWLRRSSPCLSRSFSSSPFSLPLSSSPLVNLAVSDLRRTLTRGLGPCSLLAAVSHHLAALPVYRCCLSLRIYAASLCCLQEVVEKAAWDEIPAFI